MNTVNTIQALRQMLIAAGKKSIQNRGELTEEGFYATTHARSEAIKEIDAITKLILANDPVYHSAG